MIFIESGSSALIELLQALASIATIIIALWALRISIRSQNEMKRTRQEATFVSIQDKLLEPELQEGRRLLEVAKGDVEKSGDASLTAYFEKRNPSTGRSACAVKGKSWSIEWQRINRSLAMLEVLALYSEKGLVPKYAKKQWNHVLVRLKGPALAFMEARAAGGQSKRSVSREKVYSVDRQLWPNLRKWLEEL